MTNNTKTFILSKPILLLSALLCIFSFVFLRSHTVSAAPTSLYFHQAEVPPPAPTPTAPTVDPFDHNAALPGRFECGGGNHETVKTSINIGCRGAGNPIMDMIFAIVRFLSIGVGIVMVGSFIVAGYLYITSRGDPGQTANAVKRITNNVIALLLYIFAYAILNYLIPSGVLN